MTTDVTFGLSQASVVGLAPVTIEAGGEIEPGGDIVLPLLPVLFEGLVLEVGMVDNESDPPPPLPQLRGNRRRALTRSPEARDTQLL